MKQLVRYPRMLAVLTLTALLLSMLPGPVWSPQVARAAPSADPDKEIVYIDDQGFVRVIDTRQTGTNPEVKWVSPEGGFRDFALGDFNNDTDMEIVAIGDTDNGGKLIVYDPVAADGVISDPNHKINGIPWDTLYVTQTLGSPQLVATGNFDVNISGAEIAYTFRPTVKEKPEDQQRLVVLKANSQTPNGRGWLEHLSANFQEDWESVAVGDLDNSPPDEIAFSSENDQKARAFRVEGGLPKIFEYGSDSKPPKSVAIGQWESGGRAELAFSRDKAEPLPAVYVDRYQGGNNWTDTYSEPFDPSPRFLFFANINSNSDQELIMLRNVGSNLKFKRMFVRGRNQNDIPSELEQSLDSDNGYRAGTGGDIDGDGKDEIILIRDNKLLVFTEPDRSAASNSYSVNTNRRSVRTGDLDAIGFVNGPLFAVSRSDVQATVEAGGGSKVETVNLTNATTSEAVPFSLSVDGNPSWLSVTASSGATPATLSFIFSGSNISAGDYSTKVRIDSTANVVNKPLVINVSLKVTPALFALAPDFVPFSYDCANPPATIAPKTITVRGTPGVKYSAAILDPPTMAAAAAGLNGPIYNGYLSANGDLVLRDGSDQESTVGMSGMVSASALDAPSDVSWLTANPVTGTIQSNITLTASPLISGTAKYGQALLVVVADSRAGAPPGNVRVANISIVCASGTTYLPNISR